MSESTPPDLPTRLRQHERGARQQCTCSSVLGNCMMCDLGLAADEIERLRAERDKFELAWGDISSRYESPLNQLGATDA